MNQIALAKVTVTYADVAKCCQGAPDSATLSGLDEINKMLISICDPIDFCKLLDMIYPVMINCGAHFGDSRPSPLLKRHVTLFSRQLSHIIWIRMCEEERKYAETCLAEFQKVCL